MSAKNIDDVLRQLNSMPDDQIGEIALKTDVLKITTPDYVEHRYVGRHKIPGLPFGMEEYTPGSGKYHLRQIAVVRVPTDTSREQAEAVIKRHTILSTAICCGVALLAGIFAALSYSVLNKHDDTFVLPPCTITRILPDAVFCKNTVNDAGVDVGQLFPGERYRLDSILQGQTGFSATRLKDQRSVIFQVDPKFYLKS